MATPPRKKRPPQKRVKAPGTKPGKPKVTVKGTDAGKNSRPPKDEAEAEDLRRRQEIIDGFMEKAKKATGGRPSYYHPSYCDVVEAAMENGKSFEACAGIIGVMPQTLYNWKREHPEFLEAAARGKAKRLDWWESCACSVARVGGTGGQATMIQFGLRNQSETEWRDKQAVEHSTKDDKPLGIAISSTVSEMSDKEFAERLARAKAKTCTQPAAKPASKAAKATKK
jgi:transposase-like protein